MKSFLRIPAIVASVLLLSTPVHADTVGISIGAAYWAPSLSGNFNSTGDAQINLSDDLGIDDPSSSSSVAITLEHPIPVLPNIRYQGFNLDSSGISTLTGSINYNGQTYSAGETVRSSFDLTHDDIYLYYQVLDNWLNLDVGLDLKLFDGEVSAVGSSNTTTASIKIDETIPLLYLSARVDLPFNGFYVGTDFSGLSVNDSSVVDTTIKLGYESGIGLGIEGGYKTFTLKLDDVNAFNSDLEYKGAYVKGYFHF
jgi:outer membrane protein